jgi:hypothetical protein
VLRGNESSTNRSQKKPGYQIFFHGSSFGLVKEIHYSRSTPLSLCSTLLKSCILMKHPSRIPEIISLLTTCLRPGSLLPLSQLPSSDDCSAGFTRLTVLNPSMTLLLSPLLMNSSSSDSNSFLPLCLPPSHSPSQPTAPSTQTSLRSSRALTAGRTTQPAAAGCFPCVCTIACCGRYERLKASMLLLCRWKAAHLLRWASILLCWMGGAEKERSHRRLQQLDNSVQKRCSRNHFRIHVVDALTRALQIVPHREFPFEAAPNEVVPSDHCPLVRVFKFHDSLTRVEAEKV